MRFSDFGQACRSGGKTGTWDSGNAVAMANDSFELDIVVCHCHSARRRPLKAGFKRPGLAWPELTVRLLSLFGLALASALLLEAEGDERGGCRC